jgi:hypothetical protein
MIWIAEPRAAAPTGRDSQARFGGACSEDDRRAGPVLGQPIFSFYDASQLFLSYHFFINYLSLRNKVIQLIARNCPECYHPDTVCLQTMDQVLAAKDVELATTQKELAALQADFAVLENSARHLKSDVHSRHESTITVQHNGVQQNGQQEVRY